MVTQSAELVFCDSTASLDNLNTAVFILSCGTSVGALPLAAVMTSSEDAVTLSAGLTALCHILPKCAFFGRGPSLGPLTLLTDDCASELIALKSTWPQAELHLCVFHFLQSTWRWLWSSNSGICGTDRTTCMALTERLVYAPSEQALIEIKREVDKSPFQTFKKRLDDYWQRRKEWAVCFRKNFPTRGNYTNNYSEASIRIIKDIFSKGINLGLRYKCSIFSHRLSNCITRDVYYLLPQTD